MKTKILAFLLIVPFFLQAQKTRIKFDRISLEKGLSQSSVRSIVQDEQGFIWFATLDGLNKFNGYEMKTYWNDSEDETAVTDNVIAVLHTTLYNDEEKLWVGTAGSGLCLYNRVSDNFENFRESNKPNSISSDKIKALWSEGDILWIGTNKGISKMQISERKFINFMNIAGEETSLSNNNINAITGNDKYLWIATSFGLNKFDKETETVTRYFAKDGILSDNIEALILDKKGNLWIGTPKGLSMLNVKSGKFTNYISDSASQNSLSDNNITALLEDDFGIIWIATRSGGLNRFDPEKQEFYSYKHDPTNSKSISTNGLMTLFQDNAKILWIGTSLGGVNKWNRAADDLTLFRHNPYEEYSLSSNQVRSFYKDNDGIIWVGTVERGLNKWEKEKDIFTHYIYDVNDKSSISHNHIRSILEDSKGRFWVATDGGGLNKLNRKTGKFKRYQHNSDNPKSISHNYAWKIFEDSKGNLWVGTFGGGLNKFDPEKEEFTAFINNPENPNSLSNDKVTNIIEDTEGNIWIGTFGGLNKMTSEGVFKQFVFEKGNSNSLSNNRIYGLIQDMEGNIWIGTKGGLNKLNPTTEKIVRYTTSNSALPNNVFTGILEDNSGFIWLSTNSGLVRFNKETGKNRNFDIRDGLQSNEFLAGSCMKTTEGEMFFGGIGGFNVFSPDSIKDNSNVPTVVITGFRISNQYVELDSAITEKKRINLKYFQNDISFDFVALDFIFPEKNKYAYMLEGYDNDWNYAKYRRFASYTNLSPGRYVFKVKGSNNDEIWNDEGASVVINIKPAFWQTLWFKVSVIMFILVSVGTVFRIRLQRVNKYNQKLEKQVKERTAEIRQQNDEIKAQNEEIITQRDKIELINIELTDSILYAKRIQTAALPTQKVLNEYLNDHFILFKPKDIVSGDFYWAGKKDNKVIITAADCTGHGVPGAFMSMLGISFLNKIENDKEIFSSGQILDRLRYNVIEYLHQKQKDKKMSSKDGMDIALCVIDLETKKIQFSGAYNPLYYVTKGSSEIKQIKADSMPVAIYDNMSDFTTHEIQLQKGDVIYMFSDGYADQFGGPKGKKFYKKQFRQLLFDNSQKPMHEQNKILDTVIEEWRGDEPQIDDIVVVGVRL